MTIRKLLEPDRVLRNVEARSKKHALEILSELLVSAEEDLDAGTAFDHLVERERLGSTGLGAGVALPHGRIDGIDESLGAVLHLSQGVSFDSPDGEPVRLIFGLLLPEDCVEDHLADLSAIARLLSDETFRAALETVTTSRELYDLLTAETATEAASPATESTTATPTETTAADAGGDAARDAGQSDGQTPAEPPTERS